MGRLLVLGTTEVLVVIFLIAMLPHLKSSQKSPFHSKNTLEETVKLIPLLSLYTWYRSTNILCDEMGSRKAVCSVTRG